ncbi:MAG: CocE/NonD family hydrolase [Desulfobacterales bacterium]|nr:CocE/NonD family hydrolase [Desulfobacterales bacterium]
MKRLENVRVPMRDGICLSADIYMPDHSGSFPALFSMSPYGKEVQGFPAALFPHVEAGDMDYFVNKGYVWVIADSRGRYPSEGQWNLFDKEEQQDGYELVEWIARQPWCDGKVAGMGMSYFAIIQYLVAALQPPSLKTIVPIGGCFDFYRDFAYYGGLYHSGFLARWLTVTLARCLPPDGAAPLEKWLPPRDVILDTLMHPHDGPYYDERSLANRHHRVKVPVYQIIAPSTLSHRRLLMAFESIDAPKKLLIGTGSGWALLYNESLKIQIGRWLDYWMKDIQTGIMEEPPVILYVPGKNQWRYEQNYPIDRTAWTTYYLCAGGDRGANEAPFGLLSRDMPGEEKPDNYSWPESQKQVETDLPVLAFSTAPLEEEIELVGPASLTLYASSSADDTAWVVRIDDQAPDGSLAVVGFGWLKASCRKLDETRSAPGRPYHTYKNPTRIEPGRIYRYEIEIWPMINCFKAGHRLRVRIASSDSAKLDGMVSIFLSPETPAVNTIYHDRQHPSCLLLPVIPPDTTAGKPQLDFEYKPIAHAVKSWV